MPTSLCDFFAENFFQNSLPGRKNHLNPPYPGGSMRSAWKQCKRKHTYNDWWKRTNERKNDDDDDNRKKVKNKNEQRYNFCIANEWKTLFFSRAFVHLVHGKLYDQTHQLNRTEFINNSQPISFYSKVKSLLSMEFCASNRQKEQSLWFLFIFLLLSLSLDMFALYCCFFFPFPLLFFCCNCCCCHRFLPFESILCTLRVCSNLSDFLVAGSVFNRVFLLICFV